MRALRASAATLAKGFAKVTALVGGLGAAFAAFSIGSVFKRMFGDAVAAATKEEETLSNMQVLLLKNNAIRKAGHGDMAKSLEFAKKQEDLIIAHNEELAKTGILSRDVYDAMAKQLVLGGQPPKAIMHMVGPMSELLVAIEGVAANEEKATQMAQDFNKAVFGNKLRGLQRWAIYDIDPKKWKTLGYWTKTKILLDKIGYAHGAMARKMQEPLGRIALLQKHIHETSIEIGHQLIPGLADMADKWNQSLPVIKPLILDAVNLVTKGVVGISNAITRKVIPAWQNFKAHVEGTPIRQPQDVGRRHFLEPPIPEHLQFTTQLAELYKTLKDLSKGFKDPAVIWADYSAWWDKQITEIINEWFRLKNVWSKIDWTFGFAKQWKDALDQFTGFWKQIQETWAARPTWLGGTGGAAPAGTTPAPVVVPNAGARAVAPAARAGAQLPPAPAPGGTAPAGGRGAGTVRQSDVDQAMEALGIPGFASGGVAKRPTLAMLAERGPEAVVPLNRGVGDTTVHFAPQISIAGDATPGAINAMDTRLRDLMQDFLAQFKRAQYQSRRLSFEGGYS